MTTLNDTSSIRALLATRKSASAKAMGEPGPTAGQIKSILTAAVRVPDHGKLTPWRFILFEGAARGQFGKAMRGRWQELHPDHGNESLDFVQGLFLRAPVVLALISRAAPHPKIPLWEQTLSVAAVGQTILLAAAAEGVGCQWNTDWIAYDEGMAKVMGLSALEKVAGFFYFGTPTAALEDRPRPDPMSLLTRWQAP